ncbi:MAG: bifunctional phosphopantothenoylcysteine decarboxylase/phosphopantothenate--cysteine ligase CoaBC [Clostridiales bacterium]|jgi:phosphopantothenoylcysteine decarboxylase/phosphopantothenate--cysteine ligase|nr:bifunctional phosphopantothenoylcysteine decarboxylase/phosphopantothenate--cysteine ligase CoaBC [Clostridiales bacterium]
MTLQGKTIVVGVCGGIAAYKTCTLVRLLKKAGATVLVMMTENACRFVTPVTFEALAGSRVVTDTFNRDFSYEVGHVAWAKRADLVVVAPATANLLAKLATGISDDFVTSTLMATPCRKILVCPAMNTGMLNAPATQANLSVLAARGVHILHGESGVLACGDEGAGRLAEPDAIAAQVCALVSRAPLPQDYANKTVLITAGATSCDIDGVRVLTNRSGGKMGAALAAAFAERGARVVYVHGSVCVPLPSGAECVSVTTTQEMYDAVLQRAKGADLFVMAAAPCDYTLATPVADKLKADRVTLDLVKAPDIAAAVGRIKTGTQRLVIFCAEKTELLPRAKEKLQKKNADMVVANDVSRTDIGFLSDDNEVTILTATQQIELSRRPKTQIAAEIAELCAALT